MYWALPLRLSLAGHIRTSNQRASLLISVHLSCTQSRVWILYTSIFHTYSVHSPHPWIKENRINSFAYRTVNVVWLDTRVVPKRNVLYPYMRNLLDVMTIAIPSDKDEDAQKWLFLRFSTTLIFLRPCSLDFCSDSIESCCMNYKISISLQLAEGK